MDNKSIIIQKFDGTNFYMWRFKVELVLQKEKLWNIVLQDPPATANDEWTLKDQAAKATICLSMEDKFLINVRHCTTAKNTWETLKRIYEHTSLSSKLNLRRRLYGNRYDNYPNMSDFINATLELVGQLRNIGEVTKDKSIMAVLLCGLPAEYNNLITALESKDEEDLNLEYVKIKLLEEAERREKQSHTSNPMESMAMPSVKNYTNPPRTFVCYGCGQAGHTRRDCPRERTRSDNPQWRGPTNTNNRGMSTLISQHCNNEPELTLEYEDELYTHQNQPNQCCDHPQRPGPSYSALSGITNIQTDTTGWILDSGASNHMTPHKDFFQTITYIKHPLPIKLANGEEVYAEGRGNGILQVPNDISKDNKLIIQDVLFVPALKFQLISIRQLCDRGHKIEFVKNECLITNNNKTIATAHAIEGVFRLRENTTYFASPCIHTWHRRLGHKSIENIKQMKDNQLISPVKISTCNHSSFCKTCNIGKMKQRPFPPSPQSTTKPFQTIVSDVCGPLPVPSLGGNLYFMTITDLHSRYIEVEILRYKSQVTDKLTQYIEHGFNRFGYRPTNLRTDGGGEYVNHALDKYLELHGIIHQVVLPYTPQQNGCSERVNSTLLNMCRCMIKQYNLPNKLWGEAVTMAGYIINRTKHASTGKTPYEMWYGNIPNINNIKTFGCIGYAFRPRILRSKLDETSTEGVFVGYCKNMKGYRLWIPGTNTVITTSKMTFNEKPYNFKHTTNFYQCDPSQHHYRLSPTVDQVEMEPNNEHQLRRSNRENKGVPPVKWTY